uniref:Vesicle transport through interaction with t-SNAREs homolog 1A n=1 Tax=Tabanus bromius TaxID=304241 RepID=A0A0K8TT03_TABBR
MSLIEHYEQQYAVLTAEITAQIGRLKIYSGAERSELDSKIDSNLAEAQELLEQIGLEIRDADPSSRSTLTNKLNCFQAELKRLQTEYKNVQEAIANSYESTEDFEEIGIRDEQKQRLLDNAERIERTGNKLNEGYRIIMETEQLGTGILQDLHHQRETIQTARSKTRETNADLKRTSRILNSMMVRGMREKFILYGVAVIFIIVVSLSIYFSVSRH